MILLERGEGEGSRLRRGMLRLVLLLEGPREMNVMA